MTTTCCTVYLWLPGSTAKSLKKGNFLTHITRHIGTTGHAAMQIGPSPDPTLYVSWWPRDGAGYESLAPGKKYAAKASDYKTDMDSEESWMPTRMVDAMGSRLEAPVHPGVKTATSVLKYFPPGSVSPQLVESYFHRQMLHIALGIRQDDLEYILQCTYMGDYDAFMAAMAHEASKKSSSAEDYMKSAGSKKTLDFGDTVPWEIGLSGLDLFPMIKEWWAIRDKPNAHYRALRKNCSTVVHRVLAAGGGDKLAGFTASKALFWTPSRLATYCQKINKKMKHQETAL